MRCCWRRSSDEERRPLPPPPLTRHQTSSSGKEGWRPPPPPPRRRPLPRWHCCCGCCCSPPSKGSCASSGAVGAHLPNHASCHSTPPFHSSSCKCKDPPRTLSTAPMSLMILTMRMPSRCPALLTLLGKGPHEAIPRTQEAECRRRCLLSRPTWRPSVRYTWPWDSWGRGSKGPCTQKGLWPPPLPPPLLRESASSGKSQRRMAT